MLAIWKKQHTAIKLLWLGVFIALALRLWGMHPVTSAVIGLSLPAFINGLEALSGNRDIEVGIVSAIAGAAMVLLSFFLPA